MSSRSRGHTSTRVARRRALLIDLACATLLAIIAMTVAAGVGIVAIGALITLLVVLAWTGIESSLSRARRRATARHSG